MRSKRFAACLSLVQLCAVNVPVPVQVCSIVALLLPVVVVTLGQSQQRVHTHYSMYNNWNHRRGTTNDGRMNGTDGGWKKARATPIQPQSTDLSRSSRPSVRAFSLLLLLLQSCLLQLQSDPSSSSSYFHMHFQH